MHYMPWFENPSTNGGAWGIHWTMANQNPNNMDGNGRRQIASHYYPLIGPYATEDPVTMEYHLLLLKYAGVDGLLFDWYGQGANDLPHMLANVNAMIPVLEKVGLEFAIVYEDQFDGSLDDAVSNMRLLGQTYFSHANYAKVKGRPLVLCFGPQKYQTPAQWQQILAALPQQPTMQSLWYQSGQIGNGAGEFAWIYSDFMAGLHHFYEVQAGTLSSAGGAAYPGFNSFYTSGGWPGPSWTIPVGPDSLSQTLGLAAQHSSAVDFLQLVTFNDWGEGTMFEPSVEFGYSFLAAVQQYAGEQWGTSELQQVGRLQNLRVKLAGNGAAQATLDQAAQAFIQNNPAQAKQIMDKVGARFAHVPHLDVMESGVRFDHAGSGTTNTTRQGFDAKQQAIMGPHHHTQQQAPSRPSSRAQHRHQHAKKQL